MACITFVWYRILNSEAWINKNDKKNKATPDEYHVALATRGWEDSDFVDCNNVCAILKDLIRAIEAFQFNKDGLRDINQLFNSVTSC